MKKEIEKIYKKLTQNTVFEIAEEARIQLMFESGKNSDEQKEKARTKSMAKLSAMLIYEKKKEPTRYRRNGGTHTIISI